MAPVTVSIEARCRGLWRVRLFGWAAALLLGGFVPEWRTDDGPWRPIRIRWNLDISVTDDPEDDDDDGDPEVRVAGLREAMHAMEVV